MLTQKPNIIRQNGNQVIGTHKKTPFAMSMNLTDNPDFYHLQVEIPGSKKEDLKLQVLEGKIYVVSPKTKKSVLIPKDVNMNRINSAIYDGVVCFRLPKS